MKIDVPEQIRLLSDEKKITFNYINKCEAEKILSNSTFYYKISSYKYNFRKNSKGEYIDLDFGMLYDLSVIDTNCRKTFSKMCLDIEHKIKTSLIKDITESTEDGYNIVIKFNDYLRIIFDKKEMSKPLNLRRKYKKIEKVIFKFNNDTNSYDYNIDRKYFNSSLVPILVLLEKMSLGQLVKFINFYTLNNYRNYVYYKVANDYLIMIKRIRDAASHNRPILMNIANDRHSGTLVPSSDIRGYITSYNIARTVKEKNDFEALLKLTKVHDIFCLVVLYRTYISNQITITSYKKEIKSLIYRINLYKHYYSKHKKLSKISIFLCRSLELK